MTRYSMYAVSAVLGVMLLFANSVALPQVEQKKGSEIHKAERADLKRSKLEREAKIKAENGKKAKARAKKRASRHSGPQSEDIVPGPERK